MKITINTKLLRLWRNRIKMIPAKLIKDLERIGFQLDFPTYKTNEDRIFDTLKTNNQRLFLAIPLILQYNFNYDIIINKLSSLNKGEADRLIRLFNKILAIKDEEFKYYHDSFKDFSRRTADTEDERFRENIKLRGRLNMNKSLSEIFS